MATVTLPKTLTAGTPALAADVMSNFTTLQSAINGGIEQVNIADGAISEGKIQNLAVSADKIAAGAVTNAKVSNDAAIAPTKLASTTASRALVSDVNGKMVASDVTATQLGHLSGVTSNVQTQINNAVASIPAPAIPQGGELYYGRIVPVDPQPTPNTQVPPSEAILPSGWSFYTWFDSGDGHQWRITHNLGVNPSGLIMNFYPDYDSGALPDLGGTNSIQGYSGTPSAYGTPFTFIIIKP